MVVLLPVPTETRTRCTCVHCLLQCTAQKETSYSTMKICRKKGLSSAGYLQLIWNGQHPHLSNLFARSSFSYGAMTRAGAMNMFFEERTMALTPGSMPV